MRTYSPILTADVNAKGVCDVDTVKGCSLGIKEDPAGCYGACYALRISKMRGFDFGQSISRHPVRRNPVKNVVKKYPGSWYRVGTFGDPCHDWDLTCSVVDWLTLATGKQAVIITKHWIPMSEDHIAILKRKKAVINTSVSALDKMENLTHRLDQHYRLCDAGITSLLRVITCAFIDEEMREIQRDLLSFGPIIDNPLRVPKNHPLVKSGKIRIQRMDGSVGGGSKYVSYHGGEAYWGGPPFLGTCKDCKDQCGTLLRSSARREEGH